MVLSHGDDQVKEFRAGLRPLRDEIRPSREFTLVEKNSFTTCGKEDENYSENDR